MEDKKQVGDMFRPAIAKCAKAYVEGITKLQLDEAWLTNEIVLLVNAIGKALVQVVAEYELKEQKHDDPKAL